MIQTHRAISYLWSMVCWCRDINSRDRQIYAGLHTEPAAGPLNRSSERALHKSTLLISGQAAALSPTWTHERRLFINIILFLTASSMTLSASWWLMLAVTLASWFVSSAWLRAAFWADWHKLIYTLFALATSLLFLFSFLAHRCMCRFWHSKVNSLLY